MASKACEAICNLYLSLICIFPYFIFRFKDSEKESINGNHVLFSTKTLYCMLSFNML